MKMKKRREQECCDNRHDECDDQQSSDVAKILTIKNLAVDNLIVKKVTIQREEKGHFDFKFGLPLLKEKETNTMVEVTLTNEQKVEATIAPKTSTGTPAKLDGKPTWIVQSGEGTVEVAEDGLSAFIISADTPGDTVILIEADAKEGPDVQTISDTITAHVAGALAENLGLTLGTPVPK